MDIASRPTELHRTALRLLVLIVVFAAVGTVVSWAFGAIVYPLRLAVYGAMFAAGWVSMRRPDPDAAPAVSFAYLLWWGVSLIDVLTETELGHEDRLALGVALMILSLVIPFFRRSRMSELFVFFSLANGFWVVVTGLAVGTELPDVINQALAMLVGYWMLSLMHRKFLEDAAEATRHAERSASIQQVLAAISQSLIVHQDEHAVEWALAAVGEWIGSDAALVEVFEPDSEPARRIVAVYGLPPDTPRFVDGPIESDAAMRGLGTAGSLIGLTVLAPDGKGGAYQELIVPIRVGGRTRGAISVYWCGGQSDLDQFTESIVGRAAELIAAHWDRIEAYTKLRELVASKDQFVASVSHELRTPLTAVVGFAHELVDGFAELSPDDLGEYLRLVAQQSTEVAQIVEDLLVSARADLGTLMVQPTEVDLLEEANSILDQLRLSLTDSEIRVEGGVAPVLVDRLRCRQIVRNLLTNAGRYGGRSIVVATGTGDGRAWIRVTDDGPGIPPDKLDSIFEPYVSAHERAGQPGAMGLGLSVARDLARLMGGYLVAQSLPGETTFELSFPLAASDHAADGDVDVLARTA